MTRIGFILALVVAVAAPASAKLPPKARRVITRLAGSPDPLPQATTCKMVYGNGPLIQHVKVFDVFYSKDMPDRDKYADFYTAVTASAHFDMLREYNVTNYKIGRGSYIGMYEDSKVAGPPATPTALKDVEGYLQGLITAGKVPMPDDDTLYMMYFPAGIDPYLTLGAQSIPSCASGGQFCAYHSSFTTTGGQLVRYGVMPDDNAGGCKGGCGKNAMPFQNMTDVSSHELIEAVTDPDNNTAWVDTNNTCNPSGEIGDICASGGIDEVGTVAGFTVQKEWINSLGTAGMAAGCVVTNPNVVINDFTLAVTPLAINVPVGGMATTSVTLVKTTGMAENATLTATGAPAGLVTAFSPASISSAGGTSMLTITAAPTATVGQTAMFTVKATGTVVSPTQKVTVTYVAPADMAMASGGGSGGGGGGSGDHGGSGCSVGGTEIGGAWLVGAMLLVALAFRRRRA